MLQVLKQEPLLFCGISLHSVLMLRGMPLLCLWFLLLFFDFWSHSRVAVTYSFHEARCGQSCRAWLHALFHEQVWRASEGFK